MVKTYHITDTDIAIAVSGVRNVTITDVNKTLNALRAIAEGEPFQLFNAAKVAGFKHLHGAAINAAKAQQTRYAVSKSIEVETLLYASCQDQISRGFQVMGISTETHELAVMVFSKNEEKAIEINGRIIEYLGESDDSVLDMTSRKLDMLLAEFGLTELALETVGGAPEDALSSLLVEKGALLVLRH